MESGASFFYNFVKPFAPYAELEFEILKGFNTKARKLKGVNISKVRLFNPLRG